MKHSIALVWFKRDLRVTDHGALMGAAASGLPVIPLFICEPDLYQQPDMAGRHWAFWQECLDDLAQDLQALGIPLCIRTGDTIQILSDLQKDFNITQIWSHQETGNGWTYRRDQRVEAWCRTHGIPWHQPAQDGVIRRLKTRDGWARHWDAKMLAAVIPTPASIRPAPALECGGMHTPAMLGLRPDPCPMRQRGGRTAALALLSSFLNERGEPYQKAMSSPVAAFDACSRLSPHIAAGTVSLREICAAYLKKQDDIYALPPDLRGRWPGALRAFFARLHWRCHFIQKMEDDPRIEFREMHPALRGLDRTQNTERLERWASGQTGFPMIDACMRALTQTGWINFRMRAMLVSFACYHLWLDWRPVAHHMARLFTDYEPGIHYSQHQMQAGVTGINAIRIYNPIKQSMDQDPDGVFLKAWLPELHACPPAHIHTPWAAPIPCTAYPPPVIDEASARKDAAAKMYGLRKQTGFKDAARAVINKHGSRKAGIPQGHSPRPKKPPEPKPQQMVWDF